MIERPWSDLLKSIRVSKANEEEVRQQLEKDFELREEPFIRKAQNKGKQSQDELARTDGWLARVRAKPAWVLEHAKTRARFSLLLFAFLILASYALMYLTFEPYEIGAKAHFASLGIILATCLMLDGFLVSFYSKKWVLLSLTGVALICLLAAHVQLGLVRGEIFRTLASGSESFYSRTSGILALALPLLALGVELTAGLTLFRVVEWFFAPEARAYARRERALRNMIACDQEIAMRRNRPKILASEIILRAKHGAAKTLSPEKKWAIVLPIIIIAIIVLSLLAGRAFGGELKERTVVIVDLTQSIGREGFDKNVQAVGSWLATLGPSSGVAVIGLTDESFARPQMLLQGRTGTKAGYFKERLKDERQALVSAWRDASRRLKPDYKNSDVMGAIAIAQILFDEEEGQKRLLIFSDMRHVTEALDLESPQELKAAELLKGLEKEGLIPSLKGVDVYALGVQTESKTPSYWAELRDFWKGFFARAGACLKKYSISREVD
jgi:hypothetical protein